MGKKKFIDKKRSATFQLLARDTSSLPDAASAADDVSLADRVFVRVDSNDYDAPFSIAEDDAPSERLADRLDSVFADAPDDDAEEPSHLPWTTPGGIRGSSSLVRPGGASLPDHVRREILELGLPDDGYNYLAHLREIRHAGGGAAYFQNQRARMDLVPIDVKAYDASKVRVSEGVDKEETLAVCAVASRTMGVRVQKAVDTDVARLLDEGELSMFGSDVEDLDEDFVIKANMPEEGVGDDVEINRDDELGSVSAVKSKNAGVAEWLEGIEGGFGDEGCVEFRETGQVTASGREGNAYLGGDKQRIRRPLDVQFDLIELREYNSDGDSDGDYEDEGDSLAAKLNDAFKAYPVDDLQLELQDKYKVPQDFVRLEKASDDNLMVKTSAEIIHKCTEYAEKYSQEDPSREEMVVFEESSDESEVWDCETIISTYTNLENHPGKIQAPERLRKKLSKPSADSNNNIITLRGKEKLPVDFLPCNKRASAGKMKTQALIESQQQLVKRPRDESKEEKKQRKASVKEERRAARQTKKEFKGLYKGEAQRAQKVAAFAGPSSIHLM